MDLVKLRVADVDALGRFFEHRLGCIDTIASTRTLVVLKTFKETSRLPVVMTGA